MSEIRLKLREALEKPFKLQTGQRHRIVIQFPKLDVLDVEDGHFNLDRQILLPDLSHNDGSTPTLDARRVTGIGVIYAALVHAKKNPAQGLFVTGHTDGKGSAAYNRALSLGRARNVSLLLRGLRDDWRKLCAKEDAIDDYQTLLKWQYQRAGWDCDPGPITNTLTKKTRLAIGNFQKRYNEQVDQDKAAGKDSPFVATIDADNKVGPETWGAFYDVYMDELMDLLSINAYSDLKARQAALKPPAGMGDFTGCGEQIPFNVDRRKPFKKDKDEELEGPQKNPPDRRVEILFFDPGEEVPLPCHPKPDQCKPADCLLYIKAPHKQRPIGIPPGLTLAEVNLRLTFVDPEGKVRPFPEGLEVEAKFGDPKDDPGSDSDANLFKSTEADEDTAEADTKSATPADPQTDPDAESMEVDEEPNEFVGPDGLLRFVIPRKASSFYLRILAGDDKCYVTADPKALDDQKLATLDEAMAAVGQGRVFFRLPAEFNSQEGYFKGPDGVQFKDGQFLGIDNRQTQIGSREAPAEFRLEIRWQHFQFEFHDRWTSSMATVPQPRSKDASGKDLSEPIVLAGAPELLDPSMRPPQPVLQSAWEVVKDKKTTHCLAWVRRIIVEGDPVRELPDARCTAYFDFKSPVFVRTEGDGKSPDAARGFASYPAGDPIPNTAGAERLRLYDLPTHWRSTDYPVRQIGEPLDKAKPFQKAAATPSTLDKPFLVSLDTIVLMADNGGPDLAAKWNDNALENRFAIYDHELKVHKAEPATGEPYFTQTLPNNPGSVLLDFPAFTRLISRGVVLYDVFDRRTMLHQQFNGAPIGARFAQRVPTQVVSTPFTLSASPCSGFRPNTEKGFYDRLGCSIALVLRCSGHDGEVERFHVVQYVSVNFNFRPVTGGTYTVPAGAELLPAPPADAAKRIKNCMVKVALRWNGGDAANPNPTEFEIGKPVVARGRYTAILTHGVRGTPDPIPAGEIRIHVFKRMPEGRAFMRGAVGNFELGDLEPGSSTWFTAAHEFGHVFSLPDEYLNRDKEPSLGQPHLAEEGRSDGTPYAVDGESMMVGNGQVRSRYFWDLLLLARDNQHFDAATEMTIVRGARRFTTDFTPQDKSRVRMPVEPAGPNSAVGVAGLCDRFLYVHSQDEFTGGALGGSSQGNPYHGFVVARVKMAWDFGATGDYDDQRSLLSRSLQVIHTAFNADRKFVVNGLYNGRPVRLRLLFSPRYLVHTLPQGSGADDYLKKTIDPPITSAAEYAARIAALISEHGIHADVRLQTTGTPGIAGTATPRQATVRNDTTFLSIPLARRFDDDVIQTFAQLVGSKDGKIANAEELRPLVTGLPNFIPLTLGFA